MWPFKTPPKHKEQDGGSDEAEGEPAMGDLKRMQRRTPCPAAKQLRKKCWRQRRTMLKWQE